MGPSIPKVAIITRTKNRTIFLRRAIHSILSQTFQDWLVVIVNDGGDKEAVDILVEEFAEKWQGRIKVIHHQHATGMEAASNHGIRESKSYYLAILDDDDTWDPTFLEKCVTYLDNRNFPEIAGVVTQVVEVFERVEDDKIIEERKQPLDSLNHQYLVPLSAMAGRNLFTSNSFVYERKALDKIGYYREDFSVLGDWEFNLRFLCKYEIAVIAEKLAFYHKRVPTAAPEFQNSLFAETAKGHQAQLVLLQNSILRQDLEKNGAGLSQFMNNNREIYHLNQRISDIDHHFDHHLNCMELRLNYAPLLKNITDAIVELNKNIVKINQEVLAMRQEIKQMNFDTVRIRLQILKKILQWPAKIGKKLLANFH